MKRRDFLKMASALPVGLSMAGLAQKAYAASPAYSNVTVPAAPAVMPQVINIFMYGGASELAGNLSNILDINMNSVNDYTADNAFRSTFYRRQPIMILIIGIVFKMARLPLITYGKKQAVRTWKICCLLEI